MKTPLPSAREQKKQATRNALIAAAQRRFRDIGYASTTIDDICADAKIGRRSFFRYFADKESLVFPQRSERLQQFLDLLRHGPERDDPVGNLRHIAQIFAKQYGEHRESLLAQQRLIESSAELLAREREIDRDWENAMTQAVRNRLDGQPDAEVQARLFAGAAIGVIRATMRYWFENDGRPDLAELGHKALDRLEQGFWAD
ncbi:TetR/AcrR family transcriptional regulator [Pseudomarimonas arenosa]|uniref:TetR family transcriptional regulator n=1 Tax=Pseudomarimonas arenosa TaxID=2774145 RepID=A0AAW3ZJM4_9GAMM|nr:TetR/AcrR family transcriptional regulator [Pseudomarimonas arenosa]MBD8525372.1 TetR family transcriptional regulator [Pseudomarimonas arenosa]